MMMCEKFIKGCNTYTCSQTSEVVGCGLWRCKIKKVQKERKK